MKKHKRFIAVLIAGVFVSASAMAQSPTIDVQAEENVQATEEQAAEAEKVEQEDVAVESEESSEEKQEQLEEETKETDAEKQEPITEQATKVEDQSSAVQRSAAELSVKKIEIKSDVSALSTPSGIDITMTVDPSGDMDYDHLILRYHCA